MLTRRDTIAALGGIAVGAGLGSSIHSATAADSSLPPLAPDRRWLLKLGEGLPSEFDYVAKVDGRLPSRLVGALYRNGPGLFERDGFRKSNLLDGDGMIRATTFANGRARFRSRFVRTAKYEEESKAGRFLYPTWTTLAPGFLANIPAIPTQSQAGITAVIKNGTLYAFDELGDPYGLDPATLATRGEIDIFNGTSGERPASYKAHTKTDARTGNWILVGTSGRRNPRLHVIVKDRAGQLRAHVRLPQPGGFRYFHDFFWADGFVILHLQPAVLSPVPMLMGARSFADSLSWRPELGSLLVVLDPSEQRAPLICEVPAVWMWHALNAYVAGDTIVADFVGYDAPDHFLGPDAALRAIMLGRQGTADAAGTFRRFIIDRRTRQARTEVIADGHFEFPIIPASRMGRQHRYGYAASGHIANGWYHDGIARIDTASGAIIRYHFGPGHYVGEPIFAPDPRALANVPLDRGWLLCEVLEGSTGTSYIAVFNASRIADGPTARVRLRHHLPLSFHGWWQPA